MVASQSFMIRDTSNDLKIWDVKKTPDLVCCSDMLVDVQIAQDQHRSSKNN